GPTVIVEIGIGLEYHSDVVPNTTGETASCCRIPFAEMSARRNSLIREIGIGFEIGISAGILVPCKPETSAVSGFNRPGPVTDDDTPTYPTTLSCRTNIKIGVEFYFELQFITIVFGYVRC